MILCGVIFTSFESFADKNKNARKALLKGDLEKAESLVIQSLQKDVVNPGANYLYSLIYTIDTFPRYNIDTAQIFIVEALRDWELLPEKEQEKNIKRGFYPALFTAQKERIDSLGFGRATGKGDVAAYESFMAQFPDAAQVPQAIELRDSVAFAQASAEDTWQSYQAFYQKYPNALQVPEAEDRYKTLIFDDLTSDQKLSSFREFLRKFPNTPFRKEAEEQIFEIMTASADPEAYLQFMEEYPQSGLRRKALAFLYAIDQGAYNFAHYSRYTLERHVQDSLDRVRALESVYLVPIYENGRYGFIGPQGAEFLPVQYNSVPEGYLCGEITDDFLLVENEQGQQIINRAGKLVTAGDFDFAENLGLGLLKAGKDKKIGVWHKSGFEVLNQQYADVEILNNRLLIVWQDGKAGLATLSGRILLSPQFDDIVVEGSFWVFIKDDRLAFTSLDKIAAIVNQEPLKLSFDYEELESLPGGFMLAYDGDTETLISSSQQVVIPKAVQNIYAMGDNWLVKQPFGYRIFYVESRNFTRQLFPEVEFNAQWLALKSDTAWALVNKESASTLLFNLDSAKIINEDVALSFRELQGTLHFNNRAQVNFDKGDKVYVLEEGYSREDYKSEERFLVLETSRSKQVYSMAGQLLFEQKTGNLRYLSPSYLVLEVKGKTGIIDNTGAVKLAVKYDGIGQADAEGIVSVLQDGKFGSFVLKTGALSAPKYDTRVRYFNDRFLKTTFKSKAGLIDYEGNTILPFEYDEVLPWSDTLIMAKKGEFWSISSADGERVFYLPFINYEPLKDEKKEKILKIYTIEGYGVLSNIGGQVLSPTYNDIINLGSEEQPLYFAEKHVREAEFFVVVYTDSKGSPIRSQAFRSEEYDKIYCE